MLVVAPHARQESDDLRAIAAEHQHERAALHGEFGANLEVIQSCDDFFQITRPFVLIIVRKEPWRTVTVIDYFKARALQPLDQPRRSQRRGRLLAPRQKR